MWMLWWFHVRAIFRVSLLSCNFQVSEFGEFYCGASTVQISTPSDAFNGFFNQLIWLLTRAYFTAANAL